MGPWEVYPWPIHHITGNRAQSFMSPCSHAIMFGSTTYVQKRGLSPCSQSQLWCHITPCIGGALQAKLGRLHAGSKPQDSKHGLLTTMAFQLGPQEQPQYALEGSIAIAGAGISWLRDQLGLIQSAEESEALAASVPNTAGAVVIQLGIVLWKVMIGCRCNCSRCMPIGAAESALH